MRWRVRLTLVVALALSWCPAAASAAVVTSARARSLAEWRVLTAPSNPPPRVFVKGSQVRFYFGGDTERVVFQARWRHRRIPTDHYAVTSALLRRESHPPQMPDADADWREASVIAGEEWQRFAAHLLESLTPAEPWRGARYQAFLADQILYRDGAGRAHAVPLNELPPEVRVERFSPLEETLLLLAERAEAWWTERYPNETLFVLMAPDGRRMSLPLLLDRQRRRCVQLLPAALFDSADRGMVFAATTQGLGVLVESHTLALLKNPVSSLARLADLGVETAVVALQPRLPAPVRVPPLSNAPGMDLDAWETWLDRHTGTRREPGSIEMLVDGDRFYQRLLEAIAAATNRIAINVYIFDRDDVATAVADELKRRSSEIQVRVLLDRMASVSAWLTPPTSPWPEDFQPPASMSRYLRQNSRVQVRSFLNPWFSVNHNKLYIVDGAHAWIGGMNLAREYRYDWHDLMFELRGPIVASFERDFQRAWAHAGPLGDLAYLAAALPRAQPPSTNSPAAAEKWIPLRRLPTRTAWKPFNTAVQAAIRKARRYIYVQNPYLFDRRIITGLAAARKRGVDVRVILPLSLIHI
ncbi:MAG: phosphatidylserine/phosphatidylglycerophosphate/cardiolipin synthase family protein, partial [Verrucomicrobiae bacterium]|nr:phosphatidylserine/phosphatidylglycerophosphate/cardiolipin synthase family protein [Verrucomicrobiae bacterium]